jgi:hypothetical protein
MRPPTVLLEDADLLAYAEIPSSVRFTGKLQLYRDKERVGPVPHLAILRPQNEPGLFLAHCDESWGLVGIQAWNGPGVQRIMTVGEMKLQAEQYYDGLMSHWKQVSSRDA